MMLTGNKFTRLIRSNHNPWTDVISVTQCDRNAACDPYADRHSYNFDDLGKYFIACLIPDKFRTNIVLILIHTYKATYANINTKIRHDFLAATQNSTILQRTLEMFDLMTHA